MNLSIEKCSNCNNEIRLPLDGPVYGLSSSHNHTVKSRDDVRRYLRGKYLQMKDSNTLTCICPSCGESNSEDISNIIATEKGILGISIPNVMTGLLLGCVGGVPGALIGSGLGLLISYGYSSMNKRDVESFNNSK